MPAIELDALLRSLSDSLPKVEGWINRQIVAAQPSSLPISEYDFSRLKLHFHADSLSPVRIVVVDRIPVPPLRKLGLGQLAAFEAGDYRGITYGDTYFVRRGGERDEALHMHELIHVLQWRTLGTRTFLKSYAAGFAWEGSYKENPLEDMAYRLQERFEGRYGFSAEAEVKSSLQTLHERGLIVPG